jgi:hypothetical protein
MIIRPEIEILLYLGRVSKFSIMCNFIASTTLLKQYERV